MNIRKLPFHYGWAVVFAGMLGVFAALGFGRFALGMILPSMGASLGLDYAQMGFISTGNFVGYLVAVLVSGWLAALLGYRRLIFAALLLVGGSMVLISLAEGYHEILVLYFVTGFGSGAANVPIMALTAAWFSRAKRGRAAGFIVIGSGFAIIISGFLIPAVNAFANSNVLEQGGGTVGRFVLALNADIGPGVWRVNWLILGIASLLVSLVCLSIIRDRPADVGLTPVGSEASPPRKFDKVPGIYTNPVVYHLGAIYFLFGFTYVIYVTFVVTALVRDHGFTEVAAGALWSWVGVLSLFSGPVFGALSDRLGRRVGFMTVFTLQGLSYFFLAPWLPGVFVYLSIVFFGFVAWSIPSLMAATVGDHLGAERTAQAFGFVTFIFALGQISGPGLAGMMAERTESFTGSFYLAAALAALAAVLSGFLKKPAS